MNESNLPSILLDEARMDIAVPPSPTTDTSDSLPLVPFIPLTRQRYTLGHVHGTGGIGRVWVARDDQLGREVALKELRADKAQNPEHWAWFLKEARITGQLEHPNIVPVYELAKRPENQQPFYTMRLVKGRTLSEAAGVYHQKRTWLRSPPVKLSP
jgi:serine/threonine protein kinase